MSAPRGKGRCRTVPDVTARIEAAGYRGRAIFFSVIPPWTRPARMSDEAPTRISRAFSAGAVVVAFSLLAAAALLARRNLRSGRGDRRGAFRTAAVMVAIRGTGLLSAARSSRRPLSNTSSWA